MKKVIIFRNQLFKFSETFITNQASKLTNYEPIFLGRERYNEATGNTENFALEDIERQRKFPYKHWQIITRSPTYYVDLVKEVKAELIHAHFAVDGLCALPLAKKLGIPLIVTFHGFDATTNRKNLILSRSPSWINYAVLRKKLSQEGNFFICVSEFIRKKVIALGFPEEKTVCHYIGIDTDHIRPSHIEDGVIKVLHVARLVEVKGTVYLLRALAKVAKVNIEYELTIIGEGPLKESLIEEAKKLQIEKNVKFLGKQSHDQVLLHMKETNIVILSSIRTRAGNEEGLPTVLMEASAAGKPIIGTNTGGVPEIIRHGDNGFITTEKDEHDLAEKIIFLSKNYSRQREMGLAARDHVIKNFNIDNQTKKLERIYDMVTTAS